MNEKIQEVLEANDKFYQAVKRSDIDLLKELWINDDSIKCVHPGWPMLHGWEAVSQSWVNIFSNGSRLEIELQDVQAQVSCCSAWVICMEKISYKIGDEIQHGFAQSTNIFKFDGTKWLLALHHASPVPEPGGKQSSTEVLQ